MITRIHGAGSTLAANPPKKGRKGKKRKGSASRKSHKKRSVSMKARSSRKAASPKRKKRRYRILKGAAAARALRATGKLRAPKKRGDKFTPDLPPEMKKKYTAKRRAATRRALTKYVVRARGKGKNIKYSIRKKNPGSFVIAGVPVIEMAIGSAAAIALGHLGSALISKYAPDSIKSVGFLTDAQTGIGGELITAGVAAALYAKVLKNPMHKEIAKYAFIGAVFQAISKQASAPIASAVAKLPGLGGHVQHTAGVYFDPYSSQPAVGGYLTTSGHEMGGHEMGGVYTTVDQMGGLGLFQAPSIYG